MPEPPPRPPAVLSPGRRRLVLALAFLASLSLGLAGAEWILRAQAERIRTSDQVDPGLIQPDRNLGWRLASGWRGTHRHHDFEVTYATDERGFRLSALPEREGPRVAFVGDSFTFGWGVGQGETFVERWASAHKGPAVGRNYGIPGTSTDQQVLLLEQRILGADNLGPRPDVVVIVVCLINDLFDNMRPVPLQAPYPKPYFELGPTGLVLRNVPVPAQATAPPDGQAGLRALVVPEGQAEPEGLLGWLGRRELCRRLGLFQPSQQVPANFFTGRYSRELELFESLIHRARLAVEARGIQLVVALLPGRSYVEEPESWSAAYQEHLRVEVEARLRSAHVTVVDLAAWLREVRNKKGAGPCYHPHEGHLNPEGHLRVAEMLAPFLP